MATKLKRRLPIKGEFQVLVVPAHEIYREEVTTPNFYRPTRSGFRAVAEGRPSIMAASCCVWAFNRTTREQVIQNLQYLATWIEKCGEEMDRSELTKKPRKALNAASKS